MIKVKDWILVHGFALLHAAVVITCYFLGVPDTLILTLITMAMVVLLCLKKELSVEFTAVTIILANIFGYLLGTLFAKLFHVFSAPDVVAHPLASFLTTEGIGWVLVWLVYKLKPAHAKKEVSWKENLGITRSPLKAMIEYRDLAILSKDLAEIRRDYAVPQDLEAFRLNFNRDKALEQFEKYGFKSLLDKI